jgi:prepilin-type N-terminal cleavage/methylation domain-containing protein
MSSSSPDRARRALTLVEVLICLVIFALALTPVISLFSSSHRAGHMARRQMEATMHAQTLLEAVAQLEPWELPAVPRGSAVTLLETGGAPAGGGGRWPQVVAYFARPTRLPMQRRVTAMRMQGGAPLVSVEVGWLAVEGEPVTRQNLLLETFSAIHAWD